LEHKKNFFLAFLWTIGIAIACLVSMSEVPSVSILGKDKSVHFFFYFVFSLLWFLFLTKENPEWRFAKKVIMVFLSSFVYGGVIEICQEQFTATRKADIYDVLANISGSIIAILILWIIEKSKMKNTVKK
jgi:VanZ family protein